MLITSGTLVIGFVAILITCIIAEILSIKFHEDFITMALLTLFFIPFLIIACLIFFAIVISLGNLICKILPFLATFCFPG